MQLPALITQEQYDELPMIHVAVHVGEWNQIHDQARAEGVDPESYIKILGRLTDACIAWARRRGLTDNRPAAAVADARRYCTEHTSEMATYDQWSASTRDHLERLGDL